MQFLWNVIRYKAKGADNIKLVPFCGMLFIIRHKELMIPSLKNFKKRFLGFGTRNLVFEGRFYTKHVQIYF